MMILKYLINGSLLRKEPIHNMCRNCARRERNSVNITIYASLDIYYSGVDEMSISP
jgi:hypothetical protein